MEAKKEILIKEAINYGTLDFCLNNDFCTKEEALIVFSKSKVVNIYILSSYIYFCKIFPIKDQYFEDGEFILLKNPKLMYAAYYIRGSQYLPLKKDIEPKQLFFDYFKDKDHYIDHSKLYKNIVLNNYDLYTMANTQIYGLALARHEFIYDGYEYDRTKTYIYTDWFCKIPKNQYTISLIVKRLERLSELTTFYYDAILPFYQTILEECFKDPLCLSESSFSYSIINLIKENMPTFQFPFSSNKEDILDVFFNVLDPYVAGYYLGIPIHNVEPTKEMILQCISLLKKQGIEEYASFVTKKTKKKLSKDCWYHKENIILLNEYDVYENEILSYCPFDVVFLKNKENHVYGFTRNELPSLINNGKNFWTNETIPPKSLYSFWLRSKYTHYYHLPEAKPYLEILKSIEDHPFFTFSVDDIMKRNKRLGIESSVMILEA
jgi:hypothetical protein